MLDIYEIILLLCIGLFFTYFILKSNTQIKHDVDDYIYNYYQEKNLKVSSILKLNLHEKIRYGLPLINYKNLLCTGIFSLINSTVYLTRKVELIDDKNEEYTLFLGLDVESGNVINCTEIDAFNI